MHAEIKIGDSVIMLSDEFPEWDCLSAKTIGGSPSALMIYVPDVDSAYDRAVKAGAIATQPVADQFWGDRTGRLIDPYGFKWSLATRVEEVGPEEIQKRFSAWMKENQKQA